MRTSNSFNVMHVKKIKTLQDALGIYAHILRMGEIQANINQQLTHLNRTLFDGAPAFEDLEATFIEAVGGQAAYTALKNRKDFENKVLFTGIILSASPSYFNDGQDNAKDKETRLAEWVLTMQEFIEKEIKPRGVIVSVELHLDETTPHIHVLQIPAVNHKLSHFKSYGEMADKYLDLDCDGKPQRGKSNNLKTLPIKTLSQSDKDAVAANGGLIKGYDNLTELHDRLGQYTKHLGIRRGIKNGAAPHDDLMEHYRLVNSSTQDIREAIDVLKAPVPTWIEPTPPKKPMFQRAAYQKESDDYEQKRKRDKQSHEAMLSQHEAAKRLLLSNLPVVYSQANEAARLLESNDALRQQSDVAESIRLQKLVDELNQKIIDNEQRTRMVQSALNAQIINLNAQQAATDNAHNTQLKMLMDENLKKNASFGDLAKKTVMQLKNQITELQAKNDYYSQENAEREALEAETYIDLSHYSDGENLDTLNLDSMIQEYALDAVDNPEIERAICNDFSRLAVLKTKKSISNAIAWNAILDDAVHGFNPLNTFKQMAQARFSKNKSVKGYQIPEAFLNSYFAKNPEHEHLMYEYAKTIGDLKAGVTIIQSKGTKGLRI